VRVPVDRGRAFRFNVTEESGFAWPLIAVWRTRKISRRASRCLDARLITSLGHGENEKTLGQCEGKHAERPFGLLTDVALGALNARRVIRSVTQLHSMPGQRNEHERNALGPTPLNTLRAVFVSGTILGIGALALGISACGGGSSATAPVVPPSYTLSAGALNPASITAGSRSTSTINLTPANGYTGSVNLSCGTISGGINVPTCSFSPSAVTISGMNPGTSTLTVSTSSNTPGGNYAITVNAIDANKLAPSNGARALTLTAAAVIEHVVIIFQENRSPDNLFHDPVLISRGADIANSGKNSLGEIIPLTPIDLGTTGSNPQNYDLGHAHAAFVHMYDGGKMDGANLIDCYPAANCPPNAHPNPQFKYVNPSDVQPYFALAEQFTFADRMFQTNQGPSFPAHQFIISGTSAPTATSPLFAAENTNGLAGCIAPPTVVVAMIDAAGSETAQPPQYPCFEHPTLTDLLDIKGLTWRYYAPSPGSIWTAPDAIDHICQQQSVNGVLTCKGPIWTNNVIIPETQVLTDIANGHLAQVSWIIPDGTYSDHAQINDGSGPSWVASIVNAIGNSAYWANTAIIITWDDWGGWYDHVAPKVINDGLSWGSGYVYGFRVPLIVVSPYAKAAYISHVTHDFGSILKFIETTFTLPTLGYADVAADDLSDCFNLTQSPLTFKQIPAAHAAAHFLNDKRLPTAPDDD
jgi:phospholipase C